VFKQQRVLDIHLIFAPPQSPEPQSKQRPATMKGDCPVTHGIKDFLMAKRA